MYIYNAATFYNNYQKGGTHYVDLNERERRAIDELPHLLESYHYFNKENLVDMVRQHNRPVFLDSGAFSAWTLGVSIDLPTYCDYIIRNEDIIRKEDGVLMASVLDGIGDALLTYQNQLQMESLGAKPLPCFHVGEDERYLEHYIKNYEYITLGGMVRVPAKQLMIWLDRMWDKYLTDGSGKPRLKVHGFGITAIPIMERYPWWSVDSSTWVQSASFGSIITPDKGTIFVSDKSPSRFNAGQHITTLPSIVREHLHEMVEEQGFHMQRLQTLYRSRAAYNLWSFTRVNARMNEQNDYNKFTSVTQELF